jgi:hypothetical protein
MKTSVIFNRSLLILVSLLLIAFTTGDNKSQYSVPIAAWSVSAADIDMDGDNDIVIGHKTSWQNTNPTITLLENTNNGNFANIDTSISFCGYQENIFAVCIDSDNYPDIVSFMSDFTTGIADRYIRIFYNYYGTIEMFLDFPLNSSETFSAITYGDINSDNDLDIVVASNNGQFWGVLYNDGNGNFSDPEYHYVNDYFPTDIACGDLNNNGREDIVICGVQVEIYLSTENGFQQFQIGQNELRVHIADMDKDGDNDIVGLTDLSLVGYTGISVYENQGDNSFLEHDQYDFQPSASEFIISDMNNDSFPDIVVTSHFPDLNFPGQTDTIGGIYILYNQGELQLSAPQFVPIENYGEYSRKSCCADMDGNGYNDIITIRYLHTQLPSNVNILFNDGNGQFLADPLTQIEELIPKGNKSILACYPNPFRTEITFQFTIQETATVELSVYNLQGKLIRSLTLNNLKGGITKIKWDGLDTGGKPCKPGPYFVYLKVNDTSIQSIKLIKY